MITAQIYNYASASMTPMCANCKFFEGADDGFCIRNSPMPMLSKDSNAYEFGIIEGVIIWPEVDSDDLCGDFRDRRHLTSRTADWIIVFLWTVGWREPANR
jgi:hypothetical protein